MDLSKADYILTIAELLQMGVLADPVEKDVIEVLNRFGNGEISLDEAYSQLQQYFHAHRRPKPPGTFQYKSEDEVRVAVNTILHSMKKD